MRKTKKVSKKSAKSHHEKVHRSCQCIERAVELLPSNVESGESVDCIFHANAEAKYIDGRENVCLPRNGQSKETIRSTVPKFLGLNEIRKQTKIKIKKLKRK